MDLDNISSSNLKKEHNFLQTLLSIQIIIFGKEELKKYCNLEPFCVPIKSE